MAFSTATITDGPNEEADGGGTLVYWAASDVDGTLFQLYANRELIWHGPARQVTVPTPIVTTLYQVGTVGPDEGPLDFSASLPLLMGAGNRASIDWYGGFWESATLQGFRVFGEVTAGGGVNYANTLADIPVNAPGIPVGGYGSGGYGTGGYGATSGHYWWTSDPLANGTWTFAVKAYDAAGNLSTTLTIAVAIAGPPGPPARNAAGLRLTYTYNAGTQVATLAWLASSG